MVLSPPREFADAFFQRFFPREREDRGGEDEVEEGTHGEVGRPLLVICYRLLENRSSLFAPTSNH